MKHEKKPYNPGTYVSRNRWVAYGCTAIFLVCLALIAFGVINFDLLKIIKP